MTFTPEALAALAALRLYAAGQNRDVRQAINLLDAAGVFAALDEQADTARAEGMLAESAAQSAVQHSNIPAAEALQVLHNTWDRRDRHGRRVVVRPAEDSPALAEARANTGYAAVSRLGKLEHVPGTDVVRVVRETALCVSCGLRVADGSKYHETCRPIR